MTMEGLEDTEVIVAPSYEFVKTGKSKNGVLTIDGIWRYYYCNKNRQGNFVIMSV